MNDEKIRADEGDWVEDFAEGNDDNKPKYNNDKKIGWMTFPKPGTYTVRLIGGKDIPDEADPKKIKHKMGAVSFLKYYKPFNIVAKAEKVRAVITHKLYKDEDPAWLAGFWPGKTFAIHVIDRADGTLKILEKGKTLFNKFANFQTVNDKNPAGKDAPDFVITVKWTDGTKNSAEYDATAKQSSAPLTKEETELIKASFNQKELELAKAAGENPLTWRLKNIYKPLPLEKIKELWSKLTKEQQTPPKKEKNDSKKQSTATPKIEEPKVPETEEAGDDLFTGENKKEEESPF